MTDGPTDGPTDRPTTRLQELLRAAKNLITKAKFELQPFWVLWYEGYSTRLFLQNLQLFFFMSAQVLTSGQNPPKTTFPSNSHITAPRIPRQVVKVSS